VNLDSVVVSAGRPQDAGAPLSTPLVLTSTFRGAPDLNAYARSEGYATLASYEEALGALDGGSAVAFSSGMAAVAAVVEGRPNGGVAVIPTGAYGGTRGIFAEQERLGRMAVRRVDIADTEAVIAALKGGEGIDLLWLETVTNPLLSVPDLPALIEAGHRAGALVCVDATFCSPLLVRPLELGADIVMHSATKYIAGHSDLLGGVLVAGPELAGQLRARRAMTGSVPGPLECFLALRGLRTMALRLERAQGNAATLAARLAEHPGVLRVRYPGLPSDPGHERARRQYAGFGAMVSFEVGGTAADAERVCAAVRLITHATSLGGVESLIERRARYETDRAGGVPETLLRLSVGIENVEDLWADLEQALSG
jgi:cystathionine gamma-synthase